MTDEELIADDNWCPDCGDPREACLCKGQAMTEERQPNEEEAMRGYMGTRGQFDAGDEDHPSEERQPNTELRDTATEIIDVCEGQHTIGHLKSVERVLNTFAASILAEAQQQIEEYRTAYTNAASQSAHFEREMKGWRDKACIGGWSAEKLNQLWEERAEWLEKQLAEARTQAFREAIGIVTSWGDECSGGSGREIVPSGPSKGQMYGQAYYNLAAALERAAEEGK